MSTSKETIKVGRAHKIRLVPNKEQENYFRRACGTRRMVYNWALENWKQQYEEHKKDPDNVKKPSYATLNKKFNAIKRTEYPWITELHSRIPERAIRDVGTAYKNFFHRLKKGAKSKRELGYPKFASRARKQSFYVHNASLRCDGKRVFIEKLGWVKTREELRFKGKIIGATVSRQADRWFISIQVNRTRSIEQHEDREPVGIDSGVRKLAALSNGEVIEALRSFKQAQKQLKRAQQSMSRKWSGTAKKGHKALTGEDGKNLPKSKNFQKATLRVAKLHARVADRRREYLQLISTQLVRKHDLIGIEDLSIQNMTKSAKGTLESPGKKVGQKSGLNRSILDSGWFDFRRMLEYKAEVHGSKVIPVNPAYTSQMCSQCGHTDSENRPRGGERFCCQECGYKEDADINAAKNILAAALKEGEAA